MKKKVLFVVAVVLLVIGGVVTLDTYITGITGGKTFLWWWMAPNHPFFDVPLPVVPRESIWMVCGLMGFLASVAGTIGLMLLLKLHWERKHPEEIGA